MNLVRKMTLEEWFTDYQLQYAFKKYCHNNVTVDVDVTKLVKFAEEQGQRFSPTAAVVKAVGHLVVKRPRLNRGLFYTLFGPRIVEFETVRVNLPVMIANQGKPVLSGMVVEDPAEKTVDAIHQEIRNFSAGDVSNKPVTRFVTVKRNSLLNRFLLRFLHFCIFSNPALYATKGGGISVSSLVNLDVPEMRARAVAIAHTALTVMVSGLKKEEDGRYTLLLGVAGNHSILAGVEGMDACAVLAKILSEPELESFYPKGNP